MNKKQQEYLKSKGIDIEALKELRGSKESAHAKNLLEKKLLTQEDLENIEALRVSINEKLEGSNYSFGVYFHKK